MYVWWWAGGIGFALKRTLEHWFWKDNGIIRISPPNTSKLMHIHRARVIFRARVPRFSIDMEKQSPKVGFITMGHRVGSLPAKPRGGFFPLI